MKVIVCAHQLEVGGTQVNAIELAASLRDRHGMEIVFFATPGPMLDLVRAKRLRFVAAPDARLHPSPARMRALRALVASERPDLLHAWDWWQGLEAYCAVHLPTGLPLVVTDMMMSLTRVLPREVPTTFGIPLLHERAVACGWRRSDVLVPPVDLEMNAPGVVDPDGFRRELGASTDDVLAVCVSRLSTVMKADGLVRAIAAVRRLGTELPQLRLAVVGDGLARPELDRLAAEANEALGREAVVLPGAMLDPRPAYAAADIVIGVGGSSLRGMAFAKPVIVLGDGSFAKVFSPTTADEFHRGGFYGRGAGTADNRPLEEALATLAGDGHLRLALGRFGREFVERHHSLNVLSLRLARFFDTAVAADAPPRAAMLRDVLRTTYIYLRERRFLVASRDLRPSGEPAMRVAVAPTLGPTGP